MNHVHSCRPRVRLLVTSNPDPCGIHEALDALEEKERVREEGDEQGARQTRARADAEESERAHAAQRRMAASAKAVVQAYLARCDALRRFPLDLFCVSMKALMDGSSVEQAWRGRKVVRAWRDHPHRPKPFFDEIDALLAAMEHERATVVSVSSQVVRVRARSYERLRSLAAALPCMVREDERGVSLDFSPPPAPREMIPLGLV